jgi:6-bladed beta-propeller
MTFKARVCATLFTLGIAADGHAQPVAPVAITQVPAARAPVLRLTEVARIGSMDGENDAFGRIMSAAFDSKGRIYVADDNHRRVSVFTADGRFVQHLGREGEGPGEFSTPWRVVVDPRDSVFVWDPGLARVTVFTPELRYARVFRVAPQWVVNSIEFLPGGRLLFAAYGRGEEGGLHVLRRDGAVERTFGPAVGGADLAGFEASLLGGSADVSGTTIVYSTKSPYQLFFYDLGGRLIRQCRGPAAWTTPPASVVVRSREGDGLQWNRYVHSSAVVALPGGHFLNVVHDPVNNRRLLDVVSADCKLQRRTVVNTPFSVADRQGERLLGVRTLDYPEVIVYQARMSPR